MIPIGTLMILRNTELFSKISSKDLELIYDIAKKIQVKKEEMFFSQGEPVDGLFVLLSGRVKITQLTYRGEKLIHRLIGPSEIFGIISLSDAVTEYPVSAEAERDSTALKWYRNDFLKLFENIPRLALNSVKLLSCRVLEVQTRFKELSTENVEKRIAHFLSRLAATVGRKENDGSILVDFELSKEDIAEMTGTTLFTVSRTLKRWEKCGLVQVGRKKLQILNPHGVVKIFESI